MPPSALLSERLALSRARRRAGPPAVCRTQKTGDGSLGESAVLSHKPKSKSQLHALSLWLESAVGCRAGRAPCALSS